MYKDYSGAPVALEPVDEIDSVVNNILEFPVEMQDELVLRLLSRLTSLREEKVEVAEKELEDARSARKSMRDIISGPLCCESEPEYPTKSVKYP